MMNEGSGLAQPRSRQGSSVTKTAAAIVAILLLAVVVVVARTAASRQSGTPNGTSVGLSPEKAGWDAVLAGLLSALDSADVLALGEAHGRKVDSDLRIRLIQHGDFARRVRFIVVEFATTALQPLIDRYTGGQDVSPDEAQQLWGLRPLREAFYIAVREVNQPLPAEQRIRVLAASQPDASDRNALALALIRSQVLEHGAKALVVYGSGHVWHREGGITSQLDASRSLLLGTGPTAAR